MLQAIRAVRKHKIPVMNMSEYFKISVSCYHSVLYENLAGLKVDGLEHMQRFAEMHPSPFLQ
jgi:hypothetical protein